jgi:uncharacterized tellurite resistance protein B-like protein
MVLDKLLARFEKTPLPTADTVGTPFPRRQLAMVALLIELAQSDRRIRREEMATIERIVREHFGLDGETAGRLIAAARLELDASLEDWVFATAVRDAFDLPQRLDIVERLWEVVYADGKLARLEASMMRRLCQQLGIGDADREAARAQAYARSTHRSGGEE